MPENTSEEKVKRTSKRTAGEGKRKRLIRLSPAKARRWRLFFSLVSILLVEALALVIVMSVNHYKQYPGSIKGDSITSPGRGADYIVLGWDDARNADVYKVWYKESDEPAEEEPAEAPEEVVFEVPFELNETQVRFKAESDQTSTLPLCRKRSRRWLRSSWSIRNIRSCSQERRLQTEIRPNVSNFRKGARQP